MLIIVMGVTGSGKTTVASRLAARLGVAFYDADDFHPPANKAKMAANVPLGDEDRYPWLELLAEHSVAWDASGGAVLACSALKQRYRELLVKRVQRHCFVYLKIDRDSVARRLDSRRGQHEFIRDFDRVLTGQYRDLEEPSDALTLPATLDPTELVERAFRLILREDGAPSGRFHSAETDDPRGLGEARRAELVDRWLEELGPLRSVLFVVPDSTRAHSGAGELLSHCYSRLSKQASLEVLPALGTHAPMTAEEIEAMYPGIPRECFRVHDFRGGVTRIGEVPASFVSEVSEGRMGSAIPCDLDSRLLRPDLDRIISIGQLLPHEVAGISGHDKNVFVGVGGKDTIDRTHFLGAVCGMERAMGRPHTPVRDVLNYMSGGLASTLPLSHLLTVRAHDASFELKTRGLYAGSGFGAFAAGAALCQALNVERLPEPLPRVVVYLDPAQYRSTWLGNKAIYRTRLALADGGELIVLAPGVERFGEDAGLDRLIRRHGYQGTDATLRAVQDDPELAGSLSAAAHLIHGSSEGRFRIRYAAGGLSREEVTGVGYEYAESASLLARYDPRRLAPGWNRLPDGEEVYFIPNPGVGLWSAQERFE